MSDQTLLRGDYAMGAPLFLSANEELLFTTTGTYFRTDTLRYAGTEPDRHHLAQPFRRC